MDNVSNRTLRVFFVETKNNLEIFTNEISDNNIRKRRSVTHSYNLNMRFQVEGKSRE